MILLLAAFPEIGRPTGGERRVYPLTGFPYSVLYRRRDDELRLLALRHQSRDPGFGTERS